MISAFAMLLALVASVGAGVCAYADGALLSIDPDEPPGDAGLAATVRRRDRAHRALAFARVTLQMVAGAGCAVAVRDVQGFATIPLLLFVLGGVTLVVLSETAAREAGERAGVVALTGTRRFIELIERGLVAVVALGEWTDRALASMVPARRGDDAQEDATLERFRRVVATEADVGMKETSMLTGVFSLGETTVAEVMTPRVHVVGIARDVPWAEVVAKVRSSEHSRLLVYDGNLDKVVGVLYAKDLLPYVVADQSPTGTWVSLVRPASFIPSSKRVDTQLREFRDSRRHMAVVVDEYGGTSGLLTIDDILRLIVGDIRDEFDAPEPEIQEEGGRRYWVSARYMLDKLSDVVGDDLRHDDVSTVGGLVYELFGRAPHAGESVEYRSWRFVVERVKKRRVERVYLERIGVAVVAESSE
ncbi:MAG TPA: hemolysin family protein [Gemmatimonadaceae bacterium]|nr:hemolysin family protein [Gemmatimonadaceae bacterium]